MRLYKLTDENGSDTEHQWGEGVTHVCVEECDLFGKEYFLAYTHPLLAVVFTAWAGWKNPRLWEAEGVVELNDKGLYAICSKLTTEKEIPVPAITAEQFVRFCILCARQCADMPSEWFSWSDSWLDGSDTSKESAIAAEAVALEAWKWPAIQASRAAASEGEEWIKYHASGAPRAAARHRERVWRLDGLFEMKPEDIVQGVTYISLKAPNIDFISLVEEACGWTDA